MILLIVSITLVGCSASTHALESDVLELNSSVYDELIAEYENMVHFRLSEDAYTRLEQGEHYEISDYLKVAIPDGLAYAWGNMFVEIPSGLDNPQISDFGYLLKDINADGWLEIFWIRSDGRILAIFSVAEGSPVLVGAYWSRSTVSVIGKGFLLVQSSGGCNTQNYQVIQICSNGKLQILAEFGQDMGQAYQIADKKKIPIDQARFAELIETYVEVEAHDLSKGIQFFGT